ncbi:sensor domain-containing diguanylate cyclase [Tahibacter amnicola]|uniref:diguanylate cyclase n=1 Tax=Tahibacter amnicola TaxID=2976241 RepID=A0ABY6BBC9_9GAMM|nr:7TM diverse intracellular signaling domain-containing protein [Tahibacter amnicola]UXI67112.1 diguanylate cyclase [Tahibacter amnicola]
MRDKGWSRVAPIVLLLWLLSLAFTTTASPTLDLAAGQTRARLAPVTTYIADPDGKATAAEMFTRAGRGEFAPLPGGNATFGFVEGAYWFHARLANLNHAESRWLLVLEYALLDEVDLYVRHADGRVDHFNSGDLVPFSKRSVSYRHPNFWLDIESGRPLDLLVRTSSKSSMQVPLTLYTPGAFLEQARDAQLGMGIYYGILLALLFYNLTLSLSLRDRSHFFYSAHVFGFGLVQFCLNGFAFEYLWPDWPWLANAAVPMSMSLAMLAMQLFSRDFLELPRRFRLGNALLLILASFHALLTVASTVLDYRIAVMIGTAMVFPGVAAIIFCAIVVARRKFPPAALFLLAWAMLLGGTIVYAMVSFGVLPKTFATEYGMQIGSAAEMIFLSFALAYRWASLRAENERIAREANERLEQRVEERTRELSEALQQLGEAHARLRENSARDGLTGVFNRRHFDQTFAPLLRQCLADGRPFSVLAADLDHFKRINDEYGHLVGDDCLRAVASTLQQNTPDGALVARFGGEEFIVLMAGADEPAAREAAEVIRQRVAAQLLPVENTALRLTISIGTATAAAGASIDAATLLRRADEALYEAKRSGRNRIVQGSVAA